MNRPILIAIIAAAVLGVGYWGYHSKMSSSTPITKACTLEAKLCSDGSSVGRNGPNCEFAACPEVKDSSTAKINQRITNQGIALTPLEVQSDSRCPTDVQCIWAGTVSLKVKLENLSAPTDKAELNLTLDNQVVFAGKRITLTGVAPAKNSKVEIFPADYRFTFLIKNVDSSVSDFIKVTTPTANAVVKSPLTVKGEAKGNWYFEASFPVKLFDANGKELRVMPAQAKGDWMTTNFVPFEVTLSFAKPTTATGTLVLQKDNPSDLREFDDSLTIPVKF